MTDPFLPEAASARSRQSVVVQQFRKSNVLLMLGIMLAAQGAGFALGAVIHDEVPLPAMIIGAAVCAALGIWCIRSAWRLRP